MPRIKRWFPVSHDINADPQVWALTSKCGDRSLRVWLELLSISDRNDGYLPPMSQTLARALAGRCQVSAKTVTRVWDYASVYTWIVSDPTPRVRNHARFHHTRDAKEIPPGEPETSPPILSEPILPNLPKKKDNTSHPRTDEWPSPTALFKLYNDLTPGEWSAIETISPARIIKAKKYLVQFPKKEFWEEVFAEIHKSQWLRGLSHSNGREAFRNRNLDWLMSKGKGDQVENCVKVSEGRYGE